MPRLPLTTLLVATLLWGATAASVVNPENHQKSTVAPLDFELADSRQFVRLSALPPQTTVVNFWRADCPPCLREMPLLAELARSGKVRVITVALHAVKPFPPSGSWCAATARVSGCMFSAKALSRRTRARAPS